MQEFPGQRGIMIPYMDRSGWNGKGGELKFIICVEEAVVDEEKLK